MVGSTDPIRELHDKSVEELRNLLTDKAAYEAFFHSLDQVGQLDNVRNELRRGNEDLAKKNLDKESEIAELRTQCRIIRGTELATAQERLDEVKLRENQIIEQRSPAALIKRLADASLELDSESEELFSQVVAGKMEVGDFVSKYRKLRVHYHTLVQTRIAALTSFG